jgi:hypothetical protein
MEQLLNRRSFAAVLFLLGLFFFAGATKANAQSATIYGVTTGNHSFDLTRRHPEP